MGTIRLPRALFGLSFVIALLGVILVLTGRYGPPFIRNQLRNGVIEAVRWQPDSPAEVDDRYRRNDVPGSPLDLVRFYFFNVTNLAEIRQGARPMLEEVGPFTYLKTRRKLDVWWSSDGLVQFKEFTYYTPLPNMSVGQLDAPLVTLNMPLLGVLNTIHAATGPGSQAWLDLLVQMIAGGGQDPHMDGLFTIRTPQELLWGYEDNLLRRLSRWLPPNLNPNQTIFQLIPNDTKKESKRKLPVFVDTGLYNLSDTWQILEVDGYREVTSWPCGPVPVRGTDGFQFHPYLNVNETIGVWVPELFRTLWLAGQDHVTVEGVQLIHFRPSPRSLQADRCYQQELDGLMNVTGPRAAGPLGPPNKAGPYVYVSMAHFCLADESILKMVDGVSCDQERHVTFLDVEPTTGITMKAGNRVQISSQIGSVGSTLDPNVSGDVIFPIFWLDESSQITPELARKFKDKVYVALKWEGILKQWPHVAGLAMMSVAAVLVVVGVVVVWKPWQEKRGGGAQPTGGPGSPREPLLPHSDSEVPVLMPNGLNTES